MNDHNTENLSYEDKLAAARIALGCTTYWHKVNGGEWREVGLFQYWVAQLSLREGERVASVVSGGAVAKVDK